jgi:hypothetical protein
MGIVGILVMIKFLQHNANWTSCAAIAVAVLINHHSVMATETAKTSLMRTQTSASARKMTSSVKGDIYLPDFNSNFNSIIQMYTGKSPY